MKELSKAAKDTIRLSEDVTKHFEALESNSDYAQTVDQQSFEPGRKIWIELEITDKIMSNYLFHWMYGSDSDKKTNEIFGAKMQSMWFSDPRIEYKEKLLSLINSL